MGIRWCSGGRLCGPCREIVLLQCQLKGTSSLDGIVPFLLIWLIGLLGWQARVSGQSPTYSGFPREGNGVFQRG